MDVDRWLGSITLYEAVQIWAQFNASCEPNHTVLWSGVGFEMVERWATEHHRKTLTQAMGPLMDISNPICRYHLKNKNQWSRYVHAASILFALFISRGTEVVVLTPHPPQRLNPFGESFYQNIEEPWLTACCDTDNFKILFAHPRIKEAKNYVYEYWPVDKVDEWKARYPNTEMSQKWQRHNQNEKISNYEPLELRQARNSVMSKLYLYKTGASIYWTATVRQDAR